MGLFHLQNRLILNLMYIMNLMNLMYVIIGLMMARSWFMESNDILKDTIIDAISHIWHCIVAIYSFHLIVSSFKQRYHSILKKKRSILKKSDKGRWFRVDNEVYWIAIGVFCYAARWRSQTHLYCISLFY